MFPEWITGEKETDRKDVKEKT